MAISVRRMHIPLRVRHRQASSDRVVGDAIWVVAERDGVIGVGEGTPRPYVTGEDVDSACAFVERISEAADAVDDVEGLRRFVGERQREIDDEPAAWCAVETALLDRLGHASGRSLEALLGVAEREIDIGYTLVLSDLPLEQTRTYLGMAVAAGIRDYKLKLRGDLRVDRARLEMVREAVPDASVRLDANNLWGEDVGAAIAHLRDLPGVDAVEEPLAPRRAVDLVRIAEAVGCAIVLDESLATVADVGRYEAGAARWIANIKVAKVGGAIRGQRLVTAARDAGFAVLIGAHVGETSVLTRVGRCLARAAGDALMAMEGAAGLLQLEWEPVAPVLQIGAGGRVDTSGIGPFGLGLTPQDQWGTV